MFRLASSGGCRHRAVTRHLAEQMEACGTSCDICAGWDLLASAPEAPSRDRRRLPPSSSSSSSPSSSPVPIDDLATELFIALKTLRKQIADERSVPAYIVFSDATLLQMAQRRPATETELLSIPGVGPKKLELYGARFLAVLR